MPSGIRRCSVAAAGPAGTAFRPAGGSIPPAGIEDLRMPVADAADSPGADRGPEGGLGCSSPGSTFWLAQPRGASNVMSQAASAGGKREPPKTDQPLVGDAKMKETLGADGVFARTGRNERKIKSSDRRRCDGINGAQMTTAAVPGSIQPGSSQHA